MALTRPLIRIFRPMLNGSEDEYVEDPRYSTDRISLIHSYYLIEKDIKILFDYVAPNDQNKKIFSHRIYELFFRACTEFENNATAVLSAHGYATTGRYLNITDYFKLNSQLMLNAYEVRLNVWDNGPIVFRPFQSWNTATFSSLPWYQDYNSVKHNRSSNFHLAHLENLLNAASGLLVILYAQFSQQAFSPYQPIGMFNSNDSFESANDSLFEVKPAQWRDSEKYDFDWKALKATAMPFDQYSF